MVSPTFLQEVKRFCQTTSVRGVPRIINSKSTLQSVIWTLGVLICSGLLAWQLTVVFKRYLSFQVTTLLVQSPPGEDVEFPDITVCNLNPLVHENEMNLSYTDYYTLVENKVTQILESIGPVRNFFPNETLLRTFFYNYAYYLSSNAYFTNFPVLPHFGKILQKYCPIIACSYYGWNGMINYAYTCPPVRNADASKVVQQRWVPSFYKCFTVALSNYSQRADVRGSSIIMFVDDYFGKVPASLISSDIAYTVASGMQVLVHPHGSSPDMTQGVPIGVGMSTKITVDQIKVSHLPHPHSNCTTQKTLVRDEITTYSVKYCSDICLQKHYIHECGCVSAALQFTAVQFRDANYTMCGNLSISNLTGSFNLDGVGGIFCSTLIQKNVELECEYECVVPCQEYKYVQSTTAAPWPHKSSLSQLYLSYIDSNPRFQKQFATYAALANNNLTFSELVDLEDELDRAGLAKSRFLQLSVQLNSRTFMEQKDVASLSFDAFGAQIGGVLSLWLGVTIILIFELCEVAVNLLAMSFSGKRKTATLAGETHNTRV